MTDKELLKELDTLKLDSSRLSLIAKALEDAAKRGQEECHWCKQRENQRPYHSFFDSAS